MTEGRVAKNTVYLVAASVGQKVLSFVYFTLVARAVGVEGAGKYVVATSFTTIFSIFVDLGLSNVLVREVAKVPEKAGEYLANVLGIKVILAVLAAAAATATARLLGYGAETRLMIGIATVVMLLDSTHLVLYAVMRGYQNLRYEAVGVVTGQAVAIVVGSVFMFALHLPLPFLIVALVCGSAWNVAWASYALARRHPVPIRLRFDPKTIRFFWQVTIPFALAGIFSRVYSSVDSVMLSRIVSESAVGIYGVAYKLTFAFQFLPMAFAAAMYPAMSEYYVKDRAKLGALYAKSVTYLLTFVLPLVAGIATLAGPLVHTIYGPAFADAASALRILIFSLVFSFLYWPAGSLLNACDRQAKNTLVMGMTLVVNVVMNAILLPRFSAIGAAISAFAGNVVLCAGATAFASRVIKIDLLPLAVSTVKIAFAASFMAISLILLAHSVNLLLLIAIGVIIYTVVLVGIGGLTMREVKDVIAIFLRREKKIADLPL